MRVLSAALERSARGLGYQAEILHAVEQVNYRQKEVLFHKIERHFGGDLRGKDAFTQGTLEGGRFVEEEQVENKTLCEGGMQFGVAETREGVARVLPKVWVAAGDDCVGKGLGQVLRIVIAEGNVTAR